MSARGGTIAGPMLLRLLALAQARGHVVAPLLAAAGLTREELEQSGARVPYVLADALLEAAARALGAEGLGLGLALTATEESYGVAGLLLVTGATFRQGLSRSLGYQRLWGDGERFALLPATNACVVRFRHPGQSALAAAISAECALVEVLEGVRALVDRDALPVAVDFTHESLGASTELADHLGLAPRFQQPENRIVLAGDLVDRPIHALRELIGGALERQAVKALALLPQRDSLRTRVQPLIAGEEGLARSLDDVASALRLSPRTLQRRLKLEGTSFQELVDFARQTRAAELERVGVSVKELAFRLGFQDPSALSRARRRWRK